MAPAGLVYFCCLRAQAIVVLAPLPSSKLASMSNRLHSAPTHPISFDRAKSSPARTEDGPLKGFFDDQLTRAYLNLREEETLLCSGTYGAKEPGVAPVPFSVLRDGGYDQRLLPFVPRGHSYLTSQVGFQFHRKQWVVKPSSRKSLDADLKQAMADALIAGSAIQLSLPEYARALAPRFLVTKTLDGALLPYQFQAFMVPEAIRARWVRIGRVIASLDGYTNACRRIANGGTKWEKGEPVGLRAEGPFEAEELPLARAYQFLGVPFAGPHVPKPLDGYKLEDAQEALLGRRQAKSAPVLAFEVLDETALEGSDDTLYYADLNPDYEKEGYDDDGVKLDKDQLIDAEDREYREERERELGAPDSLRLQLEGDWPVAVLTQEPTPGPSVTTDEPGPTPSQDPSS